MTSHDALTAGRAADLRRAFDRSFAEAPGERPALVEDLLAIRVAADPYALRLRDLSGLFEGRRVAALPTNVSGLLGIAGFRGILVSVYDLRILLGYPATGTPRWLALARTEPAVGLAFDGLEGRLRVTTDAITRRSGGTPEALAGEVVSADDVVRPVVHVPSVLDEITRRAHPSSSRKER